MGEQLQMAVKLAMLLLHISLLSCYFPLFAYSCGRGLRSSANKDIYRDAQRQALDLSTVAYRFYPLPFSFFPTFLNIPPGPLLLARSLVKSQV